MISEEVTRAQRPAIRQLAGFGIHFSGVAVVAEAALPARTMLAQIVAPGRQNNGFRHLALWLKQPSNYLGRTIPDFIQVGLEFVGSPATFVGCFWFLDKPAPDLCRRALH